jgi:hypothetical protein
MEQGEEDMWQSVPLSESPIDSTYIDLEKADENFEESSSFLDFIKFWKFDDQKKKALRQRQLEQYREQCAQISVYLKSDELTSLLKDLIECFGDLKRNDEQRDPFVWLAHIYEESVISWPREYPLKRNPMIRRWENFVVFDNRCEAPLPIDAKTVWPLNFTVGKFEETTSQEGFYEEPDEAFVVCLESEMNGLPSFACFRKDGAWDWNVSELEQWDRDDFTAIHEEERVRIARTEATGFYATNITEEWLREQVVEINEHLVVVKRSPKLEIALMSCIIISYQTFGNFIRLPAKWWGIFLINAPEQLKMKSPTDIKVCLKHIGGIKIPRPGTFKARVLIDYLVHE